MHQVVRATRERGAKVPHRRVAVRRAGSQRQARTCPGTQAAIEQAYIAHTGVQQQVRGAPDRRGVAACQQHGGVVADTALAPARKVAAETRRAQRVLGIRRIGGGEPKSVTANTKIKRSFLDQHD